MSTSSCKLDGFRISKDVNSRLNKLIIKVITIHNSSNNNNHNNNNNRDLLNSRPSKCPRSTPLHSKPRLSRFSRTSRTTPCRMGRRRRRTLPSFATV